MHMESDISPKRNKTFVQSQSSFSFNKLGTSIWQISSKGGLSLNPDLHCLHNLLWKHQVVNETHPTLLSQSPQTQWILNSDPVASINRERKTQTENRWDPRGAKQASKLLNEVPFHVLIKGPKAGERDRGQKHDSHTIHSEAESYWR